MSSTTMTSPCSSSFVPHPLNVDIVAEEILSYLAIGDEDKLLLLNYRLVSHKWNDLIVRKFNKSGRSFQIPLRYNSQIPLLIDRTVAMRSCNEVLESAINTLKGTATRLTFDTILVGHGFYLADEVLTKWNELLKIQGELIRHLKLNNSRSAESMEKSFHRVKDCEELISMTNLRVTFFAIPALETLDICIKLSRSDNQLLQPGHTNPRLQNLTKITIQEPHEFSYDVRFLKDIFSMAPNLSALYSKPSNQLARLAIALNAKEGPQRVTTLEIDNAIIQTQLHIYQNYFDGILLEKLLGFPFLKLTTLELNNIYGKGEFPRTRWINILLRTQSSTLVKLILGTRQNNSSEDNNNSLHFSSVMKTLKILEINLTEFSFNRINSYEEQFPLLQSLTLRSHIYRKGRNLTKLLDLLPGQNGRSNTLQEFSLISRPLPPSIKSRVLHCVYATFPTAEYHFD